MKTKLIIMICLVCSLTAFSQEQTNGKDSASSYKINTMFGSGHKGCKIPFGYFIQFDAGYTRFGHHNVFMPELSMGMIINHNWSLGMTGSFIGNPQGLSFHHTYTDSTGQKGKEYKYLKGGFGGALLEYTLFPRSLVHVSFPLMIGMGYLYWDYAKHSNPGTSGNTFYHHNTYGDCFFVIEPGVKAEMNLSKMFRIGLGVSYRWAPDLDLRYASDGLINQFNIKLGLKFGKF